MTTPPLPTSWLRLGLCAKIVRTVMASNGETKLWLADVLEERPFSDMGDAALVTMCEQLIGVEETAELIASLGTQPVDNEPRYHCGRCRDLFVITTSEGKWFRCPNCNPGVIAGDPAATEPPPPPATQTPAAREEF